MYNVSVGTVVQVQKVRIGDKKDGNGRWQGCDAVEIPEEGKQKSKCWLHFWMHPIIEDLQDGDQIMVDEITIKGKMRELKDVETVMKRPYWVPSPEFDIKAHKVSSAGGGFTTGGFDTAYHPPEEENTDGDLPF